MTHDLFAYLDDALISMLARLQDRELATELKKFQNEYNPGPLMDRLFNLSVSPALVWQIVELIHMPENSYINAEIDRREANLSRQCEREREGGASRRQNARGGHDPRQLLKDYRKLKSKLPKPCWGTTAHGAVHALPLFTRDDDATRSQEVRFFPTLCFRLRIEVPMEKGIIIKGDRPFVGHGNPLCIDKVTGWPMLRPSSLRGQLRHATLAVLDGANPKPRIKCLFGPKDIEEEGGLKGRLSFLPCYLTEPVSKDVLAPHDETSRRIGGTGPVTLEVIKVKKLDLWLQYWPQDLLSQWSVGDEKFSPREIFDDFCAMLKGLDYWFREMGIGAKASSGFGMVHWQQVTLEMFVPKPSPWSSFRGSLQGVLGWVRQDGAWADWETSWGKLSRKLARV